MCKFYWILLDRFGTDARWVNANATSASRKTATKNALDDEWAHLTICQEFRGHLIEISTRSETSGGLNVP